MDTRDLYKRRMEYALLSYRLIIPWAATVGIAFIAGLLGKSWLSYVMCVLWLAMGSVYNIFFFRKLSFSELQWLSTYRPAFIIVVLMNVIVWYLSRQLLPMWHSGSLPVPIVASGASFLLNALTFSLPLSRQRRLLEAYATQKIYAEIHRHLEDMTEIAHNATVLGPGIIPSREALRRRIDELEDIMRLFTLITYQDIARRATEPVDLLVYLVYFVPFVGPILISLLSLVTRNIVPVL